MKETLECIKKMREIFLKNIKIKGNGQKINLFPYYFEAKNAIHKKSPAENNRAECI